MYKYSLHKKSIKHICPKCRKKRFVLYVDNESQEFLSNEVGRCDREINCGYHLTPKTYFEGQNKRVNLYIENNTPLKEHKTKGDYHDISEVVKSLGDSNNFTDYLFKIFEKHKVENLIAEYKIGTSKVWNSGTVFWQIDISNKVRGGKIVLYNKSGKRTKYINWIHSLQIKNNLINSFNLKQCLFGEHLILKNDKPIAIVESEKTACIMSLMFEKYLWLASGSLQGLKESKLEILRGRQIILYPDLGAKTLNGTPFTIWKNKSERLKQKGFDIQISDLLERNATQSDREKGYDIADYFLDQSKNKPQKIISNTNRVALKMYMKNKSFKSLIEAFDLTDLNGNKIQIG